MEFKLFGYTFKLHKDGIPYVLVCLAVTLVFALKSGLSGATVFSLITSCAVFAFFRDPDRISPKESGIVVSPADGVVVSITDTAPLLDLGMSAQNVKKVSIFLSVFNVHVNRIPIAGQILRTKYHKGKFLHANSDKASDDNERNSIVIATESGCEVGCVQIAGFIARRIVSDAVETAFLATGERYGIIKFGSRVDLYLPASCQIKVAVGQTMVGGETIIANID